MESIILPVVDDAIAVTTGTKFQLNWPYDFVVTDVRANVCTSQDTGPPIVVDILTGGQSIFVTPVSLPSGALSTKGAATPYALRDPNINDDARIVVNVSQIGDGTARGLKVCLIGYRPIAKAPLPGAAQPPPAQPGTAAGGAPDVIVEDRKQSGSGGGPFTAGAWITRDLNTLSRNTIGATLAGNALQIPAGTYVAKWRCPAYATHQHQSKLRDVTNGADYPGAGSYSDHNNPFASTDSIGGASFTIGATASLQLQHQAAVSSPISNGLGVASSFGISNVYSQLWLWKVA